MNERWVTLKDGRRIPIKTNNEYMNTFIRNKGKYKLNNNIDENKQVNNEKPENVYETFGEYGKQVVGQKYKGHYVAIEDSEYCLKDENNNTIYRSGYWYKIKNKIDELEKKPKKETTPLDSNYTESWLGNWKEQKPKLIEKYEKKYGEQYDNIDVKRVKTDTKGLYSYYVYGNKKNKEE